MRLKGIDVSEWQKSIDFQKVKTDGVKFVIIREGKRQEVDDRFFEHVEGCGKAGIPVLGVYHFSYALKKGDGKKEAQSCIKNIVKADLPKDIVVFYDFEYDTVYKAKEKGVKLTRTDCINFTKEFCEEVEKHGYKAGIYANQDFYKNWYDPDLISKYVFWLAHYTTDDPKYPCVFQQYTSTGHVKGISGNVDMNWFYKTGSLVDVAKSWIGRNEQDGSFKEIIDIYNSQSDLPRKYKVKYTDEWCATFVSACAIKAGLTNIIPTECGCPQMINLFRDMGKWVEADDYVPSTGDVIFYDWQDSGSGNNTGVADHVGIVSSCDGAQIQVIEGNMGTGYVGERSIRVNGKFIRGYGVPNYITKQSVAEEVISGLWGNGDERKRRLKSAGYDPDEVQKEVNRILGVKTKTVNQLAEEVIAGLWGSGDVRKKKLTDAGYNYDAVQSAVNLLVKKKVTYKVCLEEDHKVTGSYGVLAVDESKDPTKLSADLKLCYLNYGMAETDWKDFSKYKKICLDKNEDWDHEYWVDVTKDLWISRIKSKVLEAKKRGFDGIWLDNGDIYWWTLGHHKHLSSDVYRSMIQICKWIKDQGMTLILNGADTFVSKLMDEKKESCIDGVNQETVFTRITSYSGNGKFSTQKPSEQNFYTGYCKRCKRHGLKVFLLEYTDDKNLIAKIQNFCVDMDGFYVSGSIKL